MPVRAGERGRVSWLITALGKKTGEHTHTPHNSPGGGLLAEPRFVEPLVSHVAAFCIGPYGEAGWRSASRGR